MPKRLRACALLLLMITVALCATSCGNAEGVSFEVLSEKSSYVSLDGSRVSLPAYMVTNTPSDGSVVYVTNRPYTRLSMTSDKSSVIPVYLKNASSFSLTTKAVRIVGRLEVAEGELFVTDVGYAFSLRIADAVVEALPASEMPADQALWQQFAASGFINNIMDAFNYVHFTCAWNTYSGKNDDGTQFYLQPEHAESFIKDAGKQYYYGYSDGYFDRLMQTARSFASEETDKLVTLLSELWALAVRGLSSLDGGNYAQTSVDVQDMMEGFVGYKYTVNDAEELIETYEALYATFTDWLGVWELP